MGFIASIFGGGSKPEPPPPPPPPPPAPIPQDTTDNAKDKIKRVRGGQTQTIYSSPLGVGGEANVAKQALKDKLGQ